MDKVIFTRSDSGRLARWWWSVDITVLVLVFILITIGILMVSSSQGNETTPSNVLLKHSLFSLLAIGIILITSFMSPAKIKNGASILFFISLFLLLIIALRGGEEAKGAHRWIKLYGFSIQPSEWMKPCLAVLLTSLCQRAQKTGDYFYYLLATVITLSVLALLVFQPDAGMTIIIAFTFGAVLFLSGAPWRFFLYLLPIISVGMIGLYYFFPHVQSRIMGSNDFQVKKSLEAFASGGLFGKGPGAGTVKLTLPDVHTDFILALVGEELGMIAVIGIIAIYIAIIGFSIKRLYESKNDFAIVAGGALLYQLGGQTLVNVFSVLGLGPTKGLTLPFISYGGSAMLASAISIGFVLALTRKQDNP